MKVNVIEATQILVSGIAEGDVCGTDQMLSFWGGFDPQSGKVIDCRHNLCGKDLSGKILALPKGKGSSTGSPVLLDAWAAGHGPCALILSEVDEIIALGALVYREFFDVYVPVIVVAGSDFKLVLESQRAKIDSNGKVYLYD